MTTTVPAPAGRRASRVRRIGPWVAGAILLGIGVWLARGLIADAVRSLRAARTDWLVPAVAAEVVVYGAHAALTALIFRPVRRLGALTSLQTALVAFGLGGIMPASPAEGVTAASAELGHRGVTPITAAKALVVVEWERFVAIIVLIAVDLVVAAANGRAVGLSVVGAVAVSCCLLVALAWVTSTVQGRRGAAAAAAVGRLWRRLPIGRRRSTRPAPPTVRHLIGSPRDRLGMFVLACGGWIAEAGVLFFCLRAVGVRIGFDAVLLAEAIGAAASLVPAIPGGLGAIEVAVPAMLHVWGVRLDEALAATFAWRGITLLAPAAIGAVTIAAMRRTDARRSDATARASPDDPDAADAAGLRP